MRIKYILFISVFVFLPVSSWAATYTADSCSLADVQTAYNAASTGDTVVVPAGECTWTSGLTVSKAITIIGAGSGAGGTKLIASDTMNDSLFKVTGFTSSGLMRISGFKIDLVDLLSGTRCAIKVLGYNISLDNLRIDHNEIQYGYYQIVVGGSKGVIDHNYLYNGAKNIEFTAGSAAQANASWDSMAAGTGDALFIENNYFIDDANYPATFTQEKIGTYNGGKLVARYNTFNFKDIPISVTCDPFHSHGSANGGCGTSGYWQENSNCRRGQSVVEVYNNTMEGKRIDYPVTVRGSANLIHNNTVVITAGGAPRISLAEEEYFVNSNWDPIRTEWPAEDQVHNTFLWNNTWNGVQMDSNNLLITPDTKIIEGRDFFLHEPQATGGKATFTGANGASGSYPTDGNTYPTLGTMVFNSSGHNAYYPYTPYTYPHPLTYDIGAPKNVRIEQN